MDKEFSKKLVNVIRSNLKGINPPYLTDENGDKCGLEIDVEVLGVDTIEILIIDEVAKDGYDKSIHATLVTKGNPPFNWEFEDIDRDDLALLLPFSYEIDEIIKQSVKYIQIAKFKKLGTVIRPKAKEGTVIEPFSDFIIVGTFPSDSLDCSDFKLDLVAPKCYYSFTSPDSVCRNYLETKSLTITETLKNWDIVGSSVGCEG